MSERIAGPEPGRGAASSGPPPLEASGRPRRSLLTAWYVLAELLRALWGRLRPGLTILSPVGWIVLAAAVVSLLIGLLLGWQEFVYLGATLVAGLLASVAFVFGRAAYRVTIELSPSRVVAGERALGRLEVANPRQRRSVPTRMELPVGQGLAEFALPALAPGAEHEELFAVPTNRRAVIVAGPAVSIRGDQLGLLRRSVKWSDPVELFVHPVTTRLAPSAAGLVRDLEGEVTKKVTNADISFHALREYVPGDDRRSVHWRTSARIGRLMVRQFEETRRSQLLIVHSLDERWYASDDEFELAVSVAASIAVQVVRDGVELAVVTEQCALRTRTATTLLDDSSRLQRVASRGRSTRDFVREATARIAAPSVVIVVGGSLMPLAEHRSVVRLFGLETQAFGIRVEPGGHAGVQVVGELTVLTVAELTELPRLLRRVR